LAVAKSTARIRNKKMTSNLKILMLEDSAADAELIQRILKKEKKNYDFYVAMDKKSFLTALKEFFPDVILSDNSLPQFNSAEALKITRHHYQYTPFILVTGTVSEEFAADIIKSGADDYILKDRMARLPSAIEASLKKRRAEKEIADYKYALDQSAIVAITDQKGVILYANENFCKISKYTVEELIGYDHRIVNSHYHPTSYIRYLWVTVANGKIWRGEFRNKANDGNFYWVDTTIVPFLDEDGKPYQYLAIGKDITEKKMAEEESSRNELRFQTLTSNAPVGIFQTDAIGNTIYVNETWLEYTGLTFEEAMGRGWHKILHPDDKESQLKQWDEQSKMGNESAAEFRILDKKGNTRWVIGKATPLTKGKTVTGYIGTLSDITERKRLEQELLDQQRNEQIRITATALEAQEKERTALGQELHDNVNQILVGSRMLLSMVKSNPEKTKELVDTCMGHLQDAINENRKLSHKLVTPDLEIDSLATQLSDLTHSMLETTGIKITIDAKYFTEELLNDQQKIAVYRIAQEQCTNIIKYAKASKVIISLLTANGLLKMLISDDGQGMEEGKTTKGIGLRNITGRVSVFNGKTEIRTEPGKGFILDIEMPVKESG
jgi:two-component system, NarL family, sensor histidine kinase NreB